MFAGGMRPFCIGMVHREILRANGRIYGELHGNSANQNEIASLVETLHKSICTLMILFHFFFQHKQNSLTSSLCQVASSFGYMRKMLNEQQKKTQNT